MNNKSSISQLVYEYLFQMILSMKIKPGERIAEKKIADHFGCSRAPIREALKRLEHEGIVNIFPNRFAEIANYSDEEVKQIGVVRVFHEVMAIKLCILHGSNSEIMRMREIAEQCFVAGKAGDTALRIKKDCEFHLRIALITKNKQLIKFAKELMIRIEFIQASRYIAMIDPQEQLKEHNKIIDLLVDRKKDEVIKLIIKHGTSFHGISTEYPTDFFN